MTRKFKDFGSGDNSVEPISFSIHGEEFHCKPALQGKTLLGIVSGAESEDTAVVASTIENFFNMALLKESQERFEELLNDETKIVSIETLGEITAWLVGEYSSRPQKGPEPSSTGQ